MAWVPTLMSFKCHFSSVLNNRSGNLHLLQTARVAGILLCPCQVPLFLETWSVPVSKGTYWTRLSVSMEISPAPSHSPSLLLQLSVYCKQLPSWLEMVALCFALITCPPKLPPGLLLPGKTAMPSFENNLHVVEAFFNSWVAFSFHIPIMGLAWISSRQLQHHSTNKGCVFVHEGEFVEGRLMAETSKPCSFLQPHCPITGRALMWTIE